MRRAVALQRPDLHLPEALAAELGLAAQRLLGDERIGANGAHVDLVLYQVIQLHDVGHADRRAIPEFFAGQPVMEFDFSILRKISFLQLPLYFVLSHAGQRRRDGLIAHEARGHAEVRLQDLPEIHARRDAEGI